MKIGVLTSGGDCAGLNAVLRAIVRKSLSYNYQTVGVLNGWKGIFEEDFVELGLKEISGIIHKGGTIIGTSRFSPFEQKNGKKILLEKISKADFDAIICIGGDGSMHIAQLAYKAGVNVIGIPKTIDNDIYGTDYSFGFDTAVTIAMDAIDRLHSTAESHHRVMMLEVMGRNAGWIAVSAGIAGGADVVLIPEKKFRIEEVVDVIKNRFTRGKLFSIIVVAEGISLEGCGIKFADNRLKGKQKKDDFGRERLGGISHYLADEIEKRTGFETRSTILGYVQRGGMPTAFDRILGTRFGVYAVDMAKGKKFGRMCAIVSTEIIDIPIEKAISRLKTVDDKLYKAAQVFFG